MELAPNNRFHHDNPACHAICYLNPSGRLRAKLGLQVKRMLDARCAGGKKIFYNEKIMTNPKKPMIVNIVPRESVFPTYSSNSV